jgi:transketolase
MNNEIKGMKENILKIAHISGEGHIASSFSILDILYVLYNQVKTEDDLFILSKGHASLALYAVLCQQGYYKLEDFISFGLFHSDFGGHPNRNKLKEIIASTGSLGHGLPIAVGIALSKKIKGEKGKVFCLIGDGESNEGTIWESSLLAAQYKLDNLVVILDNNHSTNRSVILHHIRTKFKNFDYMVTLIDGHKHDEIYDALMTSCNMPSMIIADTIKGYGCQSMEHNPAWHHKSPNTEELNMLLEELDNA